ncbi:HK97 gp10 family phage protein [Rhizobium lentis]|uniref:HK97-gp10 family putative phage morphogenesis protein n=1 Tax=Rhizobium lentis TaxID=1138194 RepID=UPI001C82F5FC|nr:HK97-gp10 family putative phage morphogenesis protein [Rhizobium lentis]MBX5149574.1 HK97 gp10 family phage protein [Rhizobium lentis]
MSAQSERLKRRLAAVPKAVREAVQPALVTSGNELATMMIRLAPKDTGALRDSITVTLPGQATPPYSQPGGSQVAGDNQVLITAGDTDVRYPHLVEYGTADTRAQPFFWPAYRLSKKRLSNRIKRAIRKAVKEAI